MDYERTAGPQSRIELHRELVPLAEATAVAYHVITEKPEPLKDPRDLEEVRSLVAIALSAVGTILHLDNGRPAPLGAAQIEERLFVRGSASDRNPRTRADFSGLFMRRESLITAIETLKQAHIGFGREHALAALRRRVES